MTGGPGCNYTGNQYTPENQRQLRIARLHLLLSKAEFEAHRGGFRGGNAADIIREDFVRAWQKELARLQAKEQQHEKENP